MPRNKQYQIAEEKRKQAQAKASRPLNEKAINAVLEEDGNSQPTKPKRTRRFSLVTYIDPETVIRFLQLSKWVQHWACCTHEKDTWTADDEKKNADHVAGMLKDKHTHIVLYTYDAKTSSAVKKKFDNFSKDHYKDSDIKPQNTMIQECNSMVGQWRYLRHLDDPEKVQYDFEDVVCDDWSYWNTLEDTDGLNDVKNVGLTILNDMMAGTDNYTMCQRYGKEYIYHFNHYANMVEHVMCDNYRPTHEGLRELCELALADSFYSQANIQLFLRMLEYVQNKFNESQCSYVIEKQLKA